MEHCFVNIKRLKNTIKFIDKIEEPILCIGKENPFDRELCKKLGVEYNYTATDADFDIKYYDFKTIFCFDVIEYLMNPLLFLINNKSCNIIYLCYQYNPIIYFWSKSHFVEYPKKSFKKLLEKAGYKICKYERIWFETLNFKGIRPVIRTLTNSRYYYKLRI